MGRIGRVVVGLGLIAALQGAAWLGTVPAFASDDDEEEMATPEFNQALVASDVSGIVYHVAGNDSLQVVTIYSTEIDRGVNAYVRAPALLAMVKRKDVCVGRFVTAHGVRTAETAIDVESFVVDQTTQCGRPPR